MNHRDHELSPTPNPLRRHVWQTSAASLLCLALLGCAAPPVALEQGHLSLLLSPEFEDNSRAAIDEAQSQVAAMDRAAKVGVQTELMFSFHSAQNVRHQGGCNVVRTRLSPRSTWCHLSLPQLTQHMGRLHAQDMQNAKPWERLQRGLTIPFSPWMPAQSVEVVSASSIVMAGLPAWQQTMRLSWTHQPGPVQPISMVKFMVADLAPPAAPQADRLLLQVTCGTVDMATYVEITMQDLMDVIGTLRVRTERAP